MAKTNFFDITTEEKMIRHVLLIKFKPATTTANIDQIRELFHAIPAKVDGVEAVEWGLNDSPENLNRGFTHTVLMTFADDQARRHYLPHPEHEALKDVFIPLLEDIIVFDYPV